ncbi:hypothetical protein [Cytobacillus sp. IB215665]|uniref:hypothetical protein n=1 Tax=Cytobacillus sp. IB215665 TaxID=3097357 RepID=UPI002A0DDCB6|nr:hypothetical protein [Cytobacillus sp. IB215665]MDX8367815.1 hypothetical protein [Cytobacillus sp. IB215665]
MKPINPIFDQKTKRPQTNNVRKKPITKVEGRKERIDKKKDVKIPFSQQERQLIKTLAKRKGMDPTNFCTALIKRGLKGNYPFSEIKYDPKGKPYPVKLERYFHDLLFDYTISWDCSLREAAYRIVSFMLMEESGIYEER